MRKIYGEKKKNLNVHVISPSWRSASERVYGGVRLLDPPRVVRFLRMLGANVSHFRRF